jgi:hypothetical protein
VYFTSSNGLNSPAIVKVSSITPLQAGAAATTVAHGRMFGSSASVAECPNQRQPQIPTSKVAAKNQIHFLPDIILDPFPSAVARSRPIFQRKTPAESLSGAQISLPPGFTGPTSTSCLEWN